MICVSLYQLSALFASQLMYRFNRIQMTVVFFKHADACAHLLCQRVRRNFVMRQR